MIRISILIAVLSFLGCSSKNGEAKKPERFFYFTSKFPSDVYWNVITDFTSTSDNIVCKAVSPVSGKMIPATKTEAHSLKTSGDTVKVPLFWNHPSPCEWELTDVSLQDEGDRCMQLHAITLTEDKGENGLYGDHKLMPDSLDFDCKIDSASGCFLCKEKIGAVNLGYRMPLSSKNRLFLNLNFR